MKAFFWFNMGNAGYYLWYVLLYLRYPVRILYHIRTLPVPTGFLVAVNRELVFGRTQIVSRYFPAEWAASAPSLAAVII